MCYMSVNKLFLCDNILAFSWGVGGGGCTGSSIGTWGVGHINPRWGSWFWYFLFLYSFSYQNYLHSDQEFSGGFLEGSSDILIIMGPWDPAVSGWDDDLVVESFVSEIPAGVETYKYFSAILFCRQSLEVWWRLGFHKTLVHWLHA